MKKSKINRFFKIILCVIISLSFWTLNKLSKKEKRNISLKINITDLPENLVLDSISPKNINLKIEGTGNATTKKKEINLNAKNIKNNFLFINKQEIISQLEANLKIVDVYPDSIFLFTSKKEIKKIPIKHNIQVHLKKNHWIKGIIKIHPESLLIKGNIKDLKKIDFLETEHLTLSNISSNQSGFVNLKKNRFFKKDIKLEYHFKTEKFTEASIELNIETINSPTNKEILLFPKKILLKYLVSEKKYSDIKEDDFKIVCDFKNIDISVKSCSINIIKQPKDIKGIEINKKIEFLIQ